MPTSAYFQAVLNANVTSIFPYPPPMIIKHHFWYFPDADFFIIVRGIAYGLHRRHFEPSLFFRTILSRNEPGHDIPRGTTVQLPIPFNDISPSILFTFLHYLYYPNLFVGTEEEWKSIRQLSLDWGFQRIAGLAILKILEMRRELLPPVMRQLSEHVGALGIWSSIRRRNRLHEVQMESDCDEG